MITKIVVAALLTSSLSFSMAPKPVKKYYIKDRISLLRTSTQLFARLNNGDEVSLLVITEGPDKGTETCVYHTKIDETYEQQSFASPEWHAFLKVKYQEKVKEAPDSPKKVESEQSFLSRSSPALEILNPLTSQDFADKAAPQH